MCKKNKLLLKTTTAKDNGKSSESKWLFCRQSAELNRARKERAGVLGPGCRQPCSCCHTACLRTIGTAGPSQEGHNYTISSLRPCKNVTLSIENETLSNYVSFLWPCRRICFPLISQQMGAIPGLIKHGFTSRFIPVQPSQQLPTMAHWHWDSGEQKLPQRLFALSVYAPKPNRVQKL